MMRHPSKFLRIFGPPGTGKTTRLLDELDTLLVRGVRPERIGFFAFTKKAANEAKGRALSRFALEPEDLINFRTLHSFCFRYSGIQFDQLMTGENWRELSAATGFDFGWTVRDPDALEDFSSALPDKKTVLGLINTARIQQRPLRDIYDKWEGAFENPWPTVEYLAESYDGYRRRNNTFDFTDMLTVFVENAEQLCPTFDTVFVDEAQDLSKLQWAVVEAIAEKSDRVIVAGDDDQAIFRWAGADIDKFLELDGASETLSQSYRIPSAVHALADAIVLKISDRFPKKYLPREETGSVVRIDDVTDILSEIADRGSWLILAQCAYMLDDAEDAVRASGIFYERKGGASVPENVLHAILSWKKLQANKEISGKEARIIYGFLRSGSDVRRGFKNLTGLDDDDLVSHADLSADMGLLVAQDTPWQEALSRMPEAHRIYLTAVENRGGELAGRPRVVISTIHGAKGGEADNVVLYTDVSYAADREARAAQEGSDDLARVFYVGVTRAKENLFLVSPRSSKAAFSL